MKPVLLLPFLLFFCGAGCSPAVPIQPRPQPVACTMEAKQCPDGSYVGRSGPNCEFAKCPVSSPNPAPAPIPDPTPSPVGESCSGPGDTTCGQGYQCVQDCGPVVARIGDPPPPYHCQTNEFAGKPRMCPICLASNTLIATPKGEVKVTDLKVGMRVWSPDSRGNEVARAIVKVTKTMVPSSHQVVHLLLSDARQVWVSPDHPLMDGRPVKSLNAGDSYDGAKVESADLVTYWDDATYDLLPEGDTGAYWADGIPLKSTLRTGSYR